MLLVAHRTGVAGDVNTTAGASTIRESVSGGLSAPHVCRRCNFKSFVISCKGDSCLFVGLPETPAYPSITRFNADRRHPQCSQTDSMCCICKHAMSIMQLIILIVIWLIVGIPLSKAGSFLSRRLYHDMHQIHHSVPQIQGQLVESGCFRLAIAVQMYCVIVFAH